MFEYGVILNGSQTMCRSWAVFATFEYGVILNGSQTNHKVFIACASLSMVLF